MAFLFTDEIMFSPTGIANRVSVAAAMGVAMIIVGLLAYLAAHLASPVFPAVVAAVAFVGIVQTTRTAAYWTRGAQLQEALLADARGDLHALPAGSTVIFDGICPYQGPAVVLEEGWAASAALSHTLGRQVNADTVSDRMRLTPRGVATSIYNFNFFYPFGPGLFVYEPRGRRLVPLPDIQSAVRYFRSPGRRPMRCPRGYVGQGVLI